MPNPAQPDKQAVADSPVGRPGDLSVLRRYPMALFLIVLIVIIMMTPYVEKLQDGRLIDAGLTSLLLLSALLVVSARRKSFVLGIMLLVPAFVGRWISGFQDISDPQVFSLSFFLLFICFVLFHLISFITRSPDVDSEVLCAGVASYLMLALFWAVAYTLTAQLNPDAFSGVPAGDLPLHGFDALYFSAGALTTGGFGDISPVSDTARMLGILEAITGTLYLAVLISRLVSLYQSPR